MAHRDRLQEETAKVEEQLLDGSFTTGIIRCFTTAKANAFENLLEPLQKLLRLSPPVALSLANPELFHRIVQKLQSNKAVVRLNLLRIIRSICDASPEPGILIRQYGLGTAIQRLAESDSAVLVRNMAGELVKSGGSNDVVGINSSRRRQTRRSSSSTTPPSLLTSYSTPTTPTSSRSSHATSYIFDREGRPRNGIGGGFPYRPTSRDGSGASGFPVTATGSAPKSRLPRTTSVRVPRQVIVSPKKDRSDDGVGGSEIGKAQAKDASRMPTPNSRRRRRGNADME